MASYELWVNGEKQDEIWINGEEYVEAWTSVNGTPTLVWAKDSGLAGGLYDADGNLLLAWLDSFECKVYGNTETWVLPHGNRTEYVDQDNVCDDLISTVYMYNYNRPESSGSPKVAKVVIPDYVDSILKQGVDGYSHLTEIVFSKNIKTIEIGSGWSFLSYSDVKEVVLFNKLKKIEVYEHFVYNCKNLEKFEIKDGGTDDLIIDTNTLLSYCDNLKEIALPSNVVEINGYLATNCGTNTDGMIVDLSKTKIVKISKPNFLNYSIVKQLLLPETITEYVSYAFSYMNYNTTIWAETLNLPNCHIYNQIGTYARFEKIVVPENSIIKSYFVNDVRCHEIIIHDHTIIERLGIYYACCLNKIKFIGSDFSFAPNCVYSISHDTDFIEIDFDDSISEIKVYGERNTDPYIFDLHSFKGAIHFPNSLTRIEEDTFNLYNSTMNVLDIPMGVNEIDYNGICVDSANIPSIVIRNPNITVGKDVFDTIYDKTILYFDGGADVANSWLYSGQEWTDIRPVSEYVEPT